jgi:hypothetical protein
VYEATVTPYLRASSQNVDGSKLPVIARRAPPAIAPPTLIIRPEGWYSGSSLLRAAADAVPQALTAQRRLVIRLTRVPSASPVKRMKAVSEPRPGLGSYQAGSSTRSGSICSMSTTPG